MGVTTSGVEVAATTELLAESKNKPEVRDGKEELGESMEPVDVR